MVAWKSVAQLQQVPTRNFLIRIINLPASYLTTSPGIFQNMKSRRKPYIPAPRHPANQPMEKPPTPPSFFIRQVQLLGQLLDVLWWQPKRKSCLSCLLFIFFRYFFFMPCSLLENVFSGQLCNLTCSLAWHWHIIYADCI